MCCIPTAKQTREKKMVFFQIVPDLQSSNIFTEKDLCIWATAQVKPELLKDQL